MKDIDPSSGIVSQADTLRLAAGGMHQAQLRNDMIRQAERNEKMRAWQFAEAMQYRKILSEKQAFESLQSMKRDGQVAVQFPIPPDSELPKEMRGQQPSTIRRWLESEPSYRAKIDAFRKKTESEGSDVDELRRKYPEMFGIDDSAARNKWQRDEEKRKLAQPEPEQKPKPWKPKVNESTSGGHPEIAGQTNAEALNSLTWPKRVLKWFK